VGISEVLQVIGVTGTGLAIASLIIIFLLHRRLKKLQRDQHVILGSRGSTDVVAYVSSLDEKQNHLREALERLTVEARDHEVRIDRCVSRIGVVRFDAYHDLGGRQSSAVALLDALDDGVVITTVVSREFARIYVKVLREGQPDVALAPEELEAVEQARSKGNAPFTVRPRQQGRRDDQDTPSLETADEEAKELERENRQRRRRGLPPLDALPPAASTLGWPSIERPSPEAVQGIEDTADYPIGPVGYAADEDTKELRVREVR